ncbi:MAG: hypothetical protein Q7W30_09840 [Coriobacteriia bacterium]|nr:hypothetical protein [Coriobacteriia bacterium]
MDTVTTQDAEQEATPTRPGLRERLGEAATVVLAISLLTILAWGPFFGTPTMMTLSPVAGVAAGLGCRRKLDAALAALLGVLIGSTAALLLSRMPLGNVVALLPSLAVVAGSAGLAAAVVGLAVAILARATPRLTPLLVGFAVAVTIGAAWMVTTESVRVPSEDGTTLIQRLTNTPALDKESGDDALYANYVKRLRSGQGYYDAVRDTLVEANTTGRSPVNPKSAIGYRLPTLYLLMAALPAKGISYVLLMLFVGSIGAVAAFVLARTYVGVPLALVGTAAIANYVTNLATGEYVFYTEPYAGALGLLAAAFFVRSSDRSGRRPRLMWAAAIAALAAALVREMALGFLLVGLIATLLDDDARAARDWIPWVVCTALAGIGYGVHLSAAGAAAQALTAPANVPPLPWLDVSGIGLPSIVERVARLIGVRTAFAWILLAAGVIGSMLAPRTGSTRYYLGATTLLGMIALTFLHPPGFWIEGLVPSYWMDLLAPILLACVPLALIALPGAAAPPIPDEEPGVEPEPEPAAA